jgi:Na+/H+ antiporter NhaC
MLPGRRKYEELDMSIAWDGALTLLAPLVAIVLALMTRKVIPSLAAGVFVGALVGAKADVVLAAQSLATFSFDIVRAPDKILICLFSLLVAGTVGVMGRSGGTRALVQRVEIFAKGRRGAMTSSWLAGAIVFFDDYANCLVVGSAMGPVVDRFRVSRAKLAYIVDATAAPVASLALVSTWVGYEVSMIAENTPVAGANGFNIFLQALPYRFYCILTLFFVGAIALTGRDFGPMARAEQEAFVAPPPEVTDAARSRPTYVSLAAVPIAILVAGTFGLMFRAGWIALGADAATASPLDIMSAVEDPYTPMFLGSVAAFLAASVLALATRTLSLRNVYRGAWGGMKVVLSALAILFFAWLLSDVIKATHAREFIATALEGRLDPWLLPALTFLLACATAFATGSSFSTMGVLIPIVIPLAYELDPGMGPIFLASCAAVLDGAVLGDHASPISDTTVLSSIGANVDVVTHVRTQLPYVLVVGAVAVVFGSLPAGLGWSPWVLLPLGGLCCVAVVRVLGSLPTPADPEGVGSPS